MRALVTRHVGDVPVMEVAEAAVPEWRPAYSLIQMEAASINQLSNTIRTGGFGDTPVPLIQGNDGAGTVIRSDRHPAGTRVTALGGGTYGITENGLFAEYALIPDDFVAAVPDSMSWTEAGAFAVNFLTAYGAIERFGSLIEGQTAVVTGATGGVGNALVQTLRALGAKPLGAVSTSGKADALRADGVDAVDLSRDDLPTSARALTNGAGVPVAFNPVGGPMFTEVQRSLAREGTLMAVGFTAGNFPTVDLLELIAGEKRIHGYSVNHAPDSWVRDGLASITDLAEHGGLRPWIDTVVSLDDFETGYTRLASREATGSIVMTIPSRTQHS